jgi:hypothetical protein
MLIEIKPLTFEEMRQSYLLARLEHLYITIEFYLANYRTGKYYGFDRCTSSAVKALLVEYFDLAKLLGWESEAIQELPEAMPEAERSKRYLLAVIEKLRYILASLNIQED